jgi:hypothetical protein
MEYLGEMQLFSKLTRGKFYLGHDMVGNKISLSHEYVHRRT